MAPKTLIISANPYNLSNQMRFLESYFSCFNKDNLAHLYITSSLPQKWRTGTHFQITDKRMIKARFGKRKTGVEIPYDECLDEPSTTSQPSKPKERSLFERLIRRLVWKEKYWKTKEFDEWLDKVHPEVIFLCFSADTFFFDIAFYISDRFGAPIIAYTADDWLYQKREPKGLIEKKYWKGYQKRIDELLARKVFWLFGTEKLERYYKGRFHIESETLNIGVSIPGKLEAKPAREIKTIRYLGSLEFGRLQSILDVAESFDDVDKSIKLEIYSPHSPSVDEKIKSSHKNLTFNNAVPYETAQRLICESDALLIVETTEDKYLNQVRYSLSTKVGESLSSGKFILAYGHKDAGAISFLQDNKAAIVATSKDELKETLAKFISDTTGYESTIERGFKVLEYKFNQQINSERFIAIEERIIKMNEDHKQ